MLQPPMALPEKLGCSSVTSAAGEACASLAAMAAMPAVSACLRSQGMTTQLAWLRFCFSVSHAAQLSNIRHS